MTVPASIRVNFGAPFPAQVKGSGVITITKTNGIWTVGFSMANLGALPLGTDPTVVQVLLYNTLTKTYLQTTLAALLAASAKQKTNVNFAMSPYVPTPTDNFLAVDTSGGPIEIDLTASVFRNGLDLSIKDVTGHAAVNNITVKPVGGGAPETIDGYTNAAPLVINANYGGFHLSPSTLSYVIAP